LTQQSESEVLEIIESDPELHPADPSLLQRFLALLDVPVNRARLLLIIWFFVVLASMTALPPIPLAFRVRWTIMPLAPLCVLLGWLFSSFQTAWPRIPRPLAYAAILLALVQTGVNTSRSLNHARSLTQTISVIDQV